MIRSSVVRKIIHSSVILISLFIQQHVYAQQDFTLYNMQAVPQRMYDNPSFKTSDTTIFIGLPIVSSQYFNFSSSGFKYSDLVTNDAFNFSNSGLKYSDLLEHNAGNDSLNANVNNMLSKLAKQNYISLDYHFDIFSFGFPVKKSYFSFNITENVDFRFSYSQSFMNFILNGNGASLGQTISLNPAINLIHYREYGLGWSRKINNKLTVGIKLNYLYGMENISTEKSDITLETDPNDFGVTAQSNVLVNTSGVNSNSIGNFNITNYLFKENNNGAGLDMGATYKLNDKFTFSASVVDLGFITWNNETNNYQSNNPVTSFSYPGVNMNQLINNSTSQIGSEFQTVGDSLSKTYKIDNHSYTTLLSTQMYISGSYNVTKKSNAAILLYGQLFDNTIYPDITLSFNQQVGRWLTTSISYSIYNRSYNNVGFGLALNAGAFQLYIVSDNALVIFFPQDAKNIMLHFGINLTLRHKKLVVKKPSTD